MRLLDVSTNIISVSRSDGLYERAIRTLSIDRHSELKSGLSVCSGFASVRARLVQTSE